MKKAFSLFLLLLFIGTGITAQTKTTLEKQRKKLETDIQLSKAALQKIGKDKEKSLSQLEVLDGQIDTRQKMISTIGSELSIVNTQVHKKEVIIVSLEKDLVLLKKRYAEMMYYAYQNRSSLNDMVFLLSADNFNDAMKRFQYLQQYSKFRKRQAELIEETKTGLDKELNVLQLKRAERQQLLGMEITQRTELSAEKQSKTKLLNDLKKKERQLLKDISKKNKMVADLDNQMAAIIKKTLDTPVKPKPDSKKDSPKHTDASIDVKLSGRFMDNKSKLPWPVEGTVSNTYGTHKHPVLNIDIENRGIDIHTGTDAKVKCVFDGVVVDVRSVPGFDHCLLVKHGNYFTLYRGLKSIKVNTGDKVSTRQELGTVNRVMY